MKIGPIQEVVLFRHWTKLRDAVAKRAYYLGKLEKLWLKGSDESISLGNPFSQLDSTEYIISAIQTRFQTHRPKHKIGFLGTGPEVDSVDFYCELFKEYDRRTRIFQNNSENSKPTGAGIITFENPMSANIASQAILHTDPFTFIAKMAPEPRDIHWFNLASRTAHSHSKFFRSITSIVVLFLLITWSTFVVSSIASLIDLEQIALYFPIFEGIINALPATIVQFIQGVIPTTLLASWNSCLPYVLTGCQTLTSSMSFPGP